MKDVKRLFSYLRPYLPLTLVILVLMMAATGMDLVSPMILRRIFDKGIAIKDMSLVLNMSILLMALYVVRGTINYTWGLLIERTGQRIILDLRNQAFKHMQTLSFGFFDKHQTGQIMSRLVGDMECVKNFVSWGFTELLMCFLTFVVTLGIFFSVDWKLALVIVLPTPILIFVVYRFGNRIRPAWEVVREQMGKLTAVLQENVTGIRAVKAFGREPEQISKFEDRNSQSYRKNLDRANIEATSFPLMDFMGGISFLLLVWVGGTRVVGGSLTLGTFMAFQWWVWGLIWPIRHSGWLMNMMQQAFAAAPRVWEILDAKPEVGEKADAVTVSKFQGHVRLENVKYTFADGGELLKGISLEVKPGQSIALIGSTGCGKSMVMSLIPRFYDASAGRVTIDGIDVKDMTLESLRRQVGIVMQESFLFSASIRENISYGRPDASLDDVIAAAKVADIHEFISSLPEGYESKVGERGIGLSGGQKQRVALARALVTDPRILLLDEATASVDTATERNIQKALKQAMEGRTTFIIAQRISSVKDADIIAVLEEGHIVEIGSHTELMQSTGYYKRLYDLQLSGGSEAGSGAA